MSAVVTECDHATLTTSSTERTATTVTHAHGVRAVARSQTATPPATSPAASSANRTGVAPAASGTPSHSTAPPPSHNAARRAGIGSSRRPWIPTAPRIGIAMTAR